MKRLGTAIIGGGIVGASVARYLADAGERGVAVFERAAIGSGSTAASVGGVRAAQPHRLEIELSRFSMRAFAALRPSRRQFTFHRVGYLLLATTDARANSMDRVVAAADAAHIPVRDVPSSEVAARLPDLALADVRRALFSPDDGYFDDPGAVAVAMADAAAGCGARIFERAPITGLTREARGFVFQTPGQAWRSDRIVIATNAYAAPLLAAVGVSLAAYPYPRHVVSLSPPGTVLDPRTPMIVLQDEDLLFRRDAAAALCVVGTEERSTTDVTCSTTKLAAIRARVLARLTREGLDVRHAWTGLRSMSPDRRALVGPVPGVPSAWCAVGCSGHGFMHGPALGLAIAEMITYGTCRSFDLSPLAPDRSPAGDPPLLEPGHH